MDREEAERLARRFAPAVYRLAYARTGHRADAEDVMQEVFLRLMRAAPDFRDDEHAKAWLLRVAANCAGDLFRSAWRRRARPLEEAGPDTAWAGDERCTGGGDDPAVQLSDSTPPVLL